MQAVGFALLVVLLRWQALALLNLLNLGEEIDDLPFGLLGQLLFAQLSLLDDFFQLALQISELGRVLICLWLN